MEFQRVRAILEQTAIYCTNRRIPYTHQQIFDCVIAYDWLVTAAHSERSPLLIFETLMEETMHKDNLWEWLSTELRFEAYAADIGNRNTAALSDLESYGDLNDAALDIYNERIRRFTNNYVSNGSESSGDRT